MRLNIGIVGVGKIARDQHLPTLASSPDFTLLAAASRQGSAPGVPMFTNMADMLAAVPAMDCVSLCTPPAARFEDARGAILAGKHVMLEKPPGATLSEVETLCTLAREKGVSLYASWHSRHAAAVAAASAWLKDQAVREARVAWKEDVRHWHPGQDWIWEPGGLGVFDPAINALSILTAILPETFALRSGRLEFPGNRQAPARAQLDFALQSGAPLRMDLDFLQTGPQTWSIDVETDTGVLQLFDGGARMTVDGSPITLPPRSEYSGVYAEFAALCRQRRIDVDVSPLRHVADAFMLSERTEIGAFDW